VNKIITFLLFSFLFVKTNAQEFGWAASFGNTSYDRGHSLTLDSLGNVYTSGYFQGTTDFDPDTSVFNLTSFGGSDLFVSKLDSAGHFIWAIQIGGISSDGGNSIVVDDSGFIYVTGNFNDTADFDPKGGIFNMVSAGSNDIFVCKLDSVGNLVWAKQMGGTGTDIGTSVCLDPWGNVFSTGYFSDTADFDPGIAVNNFISAGLVDIYISKLDNNGNFIWAKQVGNNPIEDGSGVCIDGLGNSYITGRFAHTVDFDPSSGVFNLVSNGQWDIFILKLDPAGNFVWVKQIGGVDIDEGYSITLDKSGNILTTGRFYGQVDFDPGIGTNYLTAGSILDVFISKLDSNGNFLWAKRMGNGGILYSSNGNAIVTDNWGSVYTTGYFYGTVDFDPGPATYYLTVAGNGTAAPDDFIQKLDEFGNFVWAVKVGDTGLDYGKSIAVDLSGNVYTTGFFSDSPDFDPGIDTFNLSSNGSNDIFIYKLLQNFCNFMSVNFGSVVDITCTNSLGFASGSAINGFAPYNYSWNTIPTTYDSVASFIQDGIYTLTVTDDSSCTRNVSILINDFSAPLNYDLNVNLIATNFRPNQTTHIWLDADNKGCVPVSGELILILDSLVSYIGGNPVPDSISGDTLRWNYTNLVHDFIHFKTHVTVTTSPTAISGDLICLNAIINPTIGDVDSINNAKEYCSHVVNSYDPNEKQVFPIGECSSGYIDSSQLITYTIRFQNIGNADALNIFIIDSLDNALDLNTVRVVCNSHAMHTEILPSNVLKFVFNNINLPDSSTNEALSHGYVVFQVLLDSNSVSGTMIKNNAHIYFDYNEPVNTNMVLNTVFTGNPYPSATVLQNSTTLTALTAGATYQWVYCDSGYAFIPGATNQSYTATINGNYAVVISSIGCSVLSSCFNIYTVGISNHSKEKDYILIKDISSGNYILYFSQLITNGSIKIFSLTGQKVLEQSILNDTKILLNISFLKEGVYLLDINYSGKNSKEKMIKN